MRARKMFFRRKKKQDSSSRDRIGSATRIDGGGLGGESSEPSLFPFGRGSRGLRDVVASDALSLIEIWQF
jgi:hypothetical protein